MGEQQLTLFVWKDGWNCFQRDHCMINSYNCNIWLRDCQRKKIELDLIWTYTVRACVYTSSQSRSYAFYIKSLYLDSYSVKSLTLTTIDLSHINI